MRCADCKFWTREKHYLWWKKTYVDTQHGSCSHPKFVYDDEPSSDGLSYMDAEGYAAGFYTGENFGCVHFTQRQEEC